MKKATLIFLSVMILGLVSSFAQKPFAGTIKSKYTVEGTTDPNILAGMPESSMIYVYENYTKSVMEMPGINVITITNGSTKMTYLIYDITGMGKYYIETTEAEIKETLANRDTKLEYTGEMKTIAGYNCEKVIETSVDKETDEEDVTILYVSKDINPNADINFGSHPGLVGFPLRTEKSTEANGVNVKIIVEAVEVTPSKKIKLADFLLPSDGKKTTQKDLMKMFGMDDEEDED